MKPSDPELEWEGEVQKLVKWQKLMESQSHEAKVATLRSRIHSVFLLTKGQQNNFRFLATVVEELIKSSAPDGQLSSNIAQLAYYLEQPSNFDSILCRSSLYQYSEKSKTRITAPDEEDRQLSAKLRCFYGVPLSILARQYLQRHTQARSRVYDLRNYTRKTRWGPFRKDGSMRVDWEMMEAIEITLGFNTALCCDRYKRLKPLWGDPFHGVRRNTTIQDYSPALLKEPDIPLDMKDPYGVTGTYIRVSSLDRDNRA